MDLLVPVPGNRCYRQRCHFVVRQALSDSVVVTERHSDIEKNYLVVANRRHPVREEPTPRGYEASCPSPHRALYALLAAFSGTELVMQPVREEEEMRT